MPNPITGFITELARNNFSVKAALRSTILKDKALVESGWFSGSGTRAGVSVTEASAMRVAAVYACVNCISWDLASLPAITYERLERGKKRAPNHPNYHLLHDEPNPEMSAFQFISSRQANALLNGNGYAEIEFQSGRPAALWPIPSDRCQPMRTTPETGKQLFYRISLPDGATKDLAPYRILHLAGLSRDGVTGMSVIRQARECIGLALAQEEFGASFYGQGTNIGAVAKHPGKLSEQGHKNLQDSIATQSEGLGRSHRMMLLEEGMTIEKMTIQPDDAQYIEGRQFQIEDIARMFRVPPHKIGHLLRATFSNIEQQNTEYYISTLRPWNINWEQEIKRKLFTPWDGDKYFSAFLFDGLLRGDTLARYQAYQLGRNAGFLSANEIREMENLNPIEGGDEYLQPLNMTAVGGEPPAAPDATAPDDLKQQVLQYVLENIADREAQNLVRALKKYDGEPIALQRWADDYYRDIGEYITEQFAHFAQPVPDGFIARYVADSRSIPITSDLTADVWRARRLPLALAQISKK